MVDSTEATRTTHHVTTHHSSLTTHHAPLTTHHPPLITKVTMRRLLSEPGWRRCCGVGFVSFHSKVDPLQIFEQAAYLLWLYLPMLTMAMLTAARLTVALLSADRARQATAAAEQRRRRVQRSATPACLAPARAV